jgi:hypothetical protein
VVYAGGGVSIEQIRKGAGYVAELQREMDRTRRERLQLLGFEPAAASQMSAYHKKTSCEALEHAWAPYVRLAVISVRSPPIAGG